MTSSTYPGAYDTFTNPASTDAMNAVSHSQQHDHINDAVAAIQQILGTNPNGSGAATVAARMANNESSVASNTSSISSLNTQMSSKVSLGGDIGGTATAPTVISGANHTHTASQISGLPQAATTTPAALAGTAAVGTSSNYARADHAHLLPSLTTLGAAASGTTVSAGSGLTGGGTIGTTSGSISLAANFAGTGAATTVARSDHNHDGTYTKFVIQTLGSTLPTASSYPEGTIVAQY